MVVMMAYRGMSRYTNQTPAKAKGSLVRMTMHMDLLVIPVHCHS